MALLFNDTRSECPYYSRNLDGSVLLFKESSCPYYSRNPDGSVPTIQEVLTIQGIQRPVSLLFKEFHNIEHCCYSHRSSSSFLLLCSSASLCFLASSLSLSLSLSSATLRARASFSAAAAAASESGLSAPLGLSHTLSPVISGHWSSSEAVEWNTLQDSLIQSHSQTHKKNWSLVLSDYVEWNATRLFTPVSFPDPCSYCMKNADIFFWYTVEPLLKDTRDTSVLRTL